MDLRSVLCSVCSLVESSVATTATQSDNWMERLSVARLGYSLADQSAVSKARNSVKLLERNLALETALNLAATMVFLSDEQLVDR